MTTAPATWPAMPGSGTLLSSQLLQPGDLAPDHVWKVASFGSSSGSVSSVKQQLLCKGPLSVCSGNWWHCVVLVDGTTVLAAVSWLIKNSSWGTGWEAAVWLDRVHR